MGTDFESSILEVADHYKKYDPKWNMKPDERRKVIKYLMCGYTATDICEAITGMFFSDFHCGGNRDKEVFTGFLYVFREHNFDKFRKLAEEGKAAAKSRVKSKRESLERDKAVADAENDMKENYMNGFRYARFLRDSDISEN